MKPNLPEAHFYYAAFVLEPAGRLAEAEEHQRLAHRLDPLSPVVVHGTAVLRLMLRQYEEAAAVFRRVLELEPEYPWAHRGLGEIAILEGRYADALRSLERIEMPTLSAGLAGYAEAKLGNEDRARSAVRRLELSGHPSVAYQVALIRLAVNEVDAAFEALECACAARDVGVIWLPVDPIWEPLRADPRFARLVSAMGLEPRPGVPGLTHPIASKRRSRRAGCH